jgi:Thrombospondin type 3 repeat
MLLLGVAGSLFVLAAGALILTAAGRSSAVQDPTIGLDLFLAGNTYGDIVNEMSIGDTDACLTTNPPGNSSGHTHNAHLVIRNVEDLVGWSARFNYIGDKMRIASVNVTPYIDSLRGGDVGFVNLPLDPATFGHRGVTASVSIPAAPPDNTNTPQTASVGASYLGTRTLAISPDTPPKEPADDDSYIAASGGILALVQLQVVGNEQGHQLFMNLDDGSPNAPGSSFSYFNGAGLVEVPLPSGALGDGFHGEGVTCTPQDCTTLECPAATPTPTATPADSDGDGVPNAGDNCPSWPNPAQNLPPWPVPANDPDCDGFTTTVENSAGTNPNAHCGASAWPPDINNDGFVDVIGDIAQIAGQFGNGVPPAPVRYDIAPDPPDQVIDVIGDISRMAGFFSLSCS